MEKYYIPSETEFHIGFEYLYCPYPFKIKEDKDFEPEICNEDNFEDILREYLPVGVIRVKYLDKDDIKELGWSELFSKGDSFTFVKKRDDTIFHLDYLEGSLGIIISRGADDTPHADFDILFSGFPRNKSELKMIMLLTACLE